MHNYQKLKIWQETLDISVEVFELTARFPKEEVYGLSAQMRRCAVSIVSNIAEGAGRNSNAEFNHFLGISIGSSYELETQLHISERLKYCPETKFTELKTRLQQTQKMTFQLKSKLLKATI